ncbi:MAG: ureidoglycolate lyase [Clostridia bacterium]
MKYVAVEKLTQAAFAPFGEVIETQDRPFGGEAGMYRWYEKQAQVEDAQTVSINLLTALERAYTCKRFEAHARTTETLLPLTGGVIVAGVPAGEVTAERLRAFYVPVGKGIMWRAGAWHFAPYPIGAEATCAVIFRHGTGGDDAVFEELPEEIGFKL